jgi:hypothetical protein
MKKEEKNANYLINKILIFWSFINELESHYVA